MKKRLWLIAPAVVGVLGLAAAVIGLVPIKASSGHFEVTEQLLQFFKHRSVAFGSGEVELPPLDAGWLVLKGAGHYEIGCRPCHGSPGFPPPPVATAMLPPPPGLADRVRYYSPRELFYVVKHGIKFTGMPAWPALNRDDEVAAVVAFLAKWPELDREGYAALVYGEQGESGTAAAPIEELSGKVEAGVVVSSCARCHGLDGLARGSPAFPVLAGQKVEYLAESLKAYLEGRRHSGIMQPIAAGLDAQKLREAAEHYAKLPRARKRAPVDEEAVRRGADIATHGVPADRVPACGACHDPSRETNGVYPRLDGQWAEYLVLQLELFSGQGRGGTAWWQLMDRAVHRLTPEQMSDVAAFYAAQ
ncbi:MAG: c-type cytochrome [Myxococcaceae bacterium]|nr:c-type cytochrome [Myxococcaceae bacterium]